MSLLSLPNELLLIIASPLDTQDLNSLLRVNRRLTVLLTQSLQEHASRPRVVRRDNFPPVACTLHWAAWKGYDGLFRILLEKGFDVTQCHVGGVNETLLHFAACSGNEAIIKTLLCKGADIDANIRHGETPLHYAVHCGREPVVRLLLDRGARVDTELPLLACTMRHHVGVWTTRHPACMEWKWNADIVNLLIDRGAPIDAQDKIIGATALHEASRFGDLEMIEILLSRGASTTIRCQSGQTAFEWALRSQAAEAIKLFQMKGLIPLLGGRYYDERKPRGGLEYWRLACGTGRTNRLRSVWKACINGDPTAGASNNKKPRKYWKISRK